MLNKDQKKKKKKPQNLLNQRKKAFLEYFDEQMEGMHPVFCLAITMTRAVCSPFLFTH